MGVKQYHCAFIYVTLYKTLIMGSGRKLIWMETKCNLDSTYQIYMTSSWENVSSGVSKLVRLKLACSVTCGLEILVTETRDITLSRQQTTKALIRLPGCAGWSAPLLFAYDIRHVFSWPGSHILQIYLLLCAFRIAYISNVVIVKQMYFHVHVFTMVASDSGLR